MYPVADSRYEARMAGWLHEQTPRPADREPAVLSSHRDATGSSSRARAALRHRGSLTDAAMTREVAPTGRRGRQPIHDAAATRACLTMKSPVRAGAAAKRPELAGADRAVPEFSILSRRQIETGLWPQRSRASPLRTKGKHAPARIGRAAAPPHRHRAGKRHQFERTGETTSESEVRAIRRRAGMVAAADVSDAGSTSESARKRWKYTPRSSPSATPVMSNRRRLPPLLETVPSPPASTMTPSLHGARPRSCRPAGMPDPGNLTRPGHAPATKGLYASRSRGRSKGRALVYRN